MSVVDTTLGFVLEKDAILSNVRFFTRPDVNVKPGLFFQLRRTRPQTEGGLIGEELPAFFFAAT